MHACISAWCCYSKTFLIQHLYNSAPLYSCSVLGLSMYACMYVHVIVVVIDNKMVLCLVCDCLKCACICAVYTTYGHSVHALFATILLPYACSQHWECIHHWGEYSVKMKSIILEYSLKQVGGFNTPAQYSRYSKGVYIEVSITTKGC